MKNAPKQLLDRLMNRERGGVQRKTIGLCRRNEEFSRW